MPNNNVSNKSITDQILDEMFVKLRENNDFDNDTVNRLEELRNNSELNELKKVHNAIIPPSEEDNETN
jgi:hypothetical protein